MFVLWMVVIVMKILLVAMPDSIHTVRWISQITEQGWEIHLFPCYNAPVHPEMRGVIIQRSLYSNLESFSLSLSNRYISFCYRVILAVLRVILTKFFPECLDISLRKIIYDLKPDIVHSLEIQHAGYKVLDAKKLFSGAFPPWIVTNWGSDIYLFGRIAQHSQKIKEVLAACNYYSCECRRDVCLAKAYGFEGTVLPVFPNTGGFDLTATARLRQSGPISNRRLIMLKGYQTWAGRALVGLRALERCADLLKDYELVVYCPSNEVTIATELFTQNTGVRTTLIPFGTPHQELLKLHGRARISLGLSIGDAISTSLLEALVMGSFPIQSWTACADEWFEDGITGILVPPEDPDVIEQAIRRALLDDNLVNAAAERNEHTVCDRLNYTMLKQKAVEMYQIVAQGHGISI